MKMVNSILLLAITIVALVTALPVTRNKKDDTPADPSTEKPTGADLKSVLEYERYLREVVEVLETDPEFRKKIDTVAEADIRSGKIAQELDYVNHHVRSKLDEIKRREIDRLRSLANKEFELTNEIDREHMKIPQHIDHGNEHTFEIEDLKKLIMKATEDLAEADKKRREEFKEYEMQKEFEKQATLKELDEESKKKFEEEARKNKERHNEHEKVHHPGNKAQLEEVWEKQDHLDKDDFNPRTFFMLHDVDSNGVWDETEVKALFVKELDKVYQSGLPEDDMRERAEEMERMREHVFKETDTNRDGLISFQEFMDQTKREEFNRDPGWDTVDNEPQYTHEEYLEFERRRQEEVQRMIAQGLLPPHPNMPNGYYPNPNQQQFQGNPQVQGQQMHYQMQPPQQYHPEAIQQQQQQFQHPGQPVQVHPNQVYQQVQQQQQQYQQQQQQQYQQYQQTQQQYQQPPQQQQMPVQQQQQVPVQQQQQAPQMQQQQPHPNQLPPQPQQQQAAPAPPQQQQPVQQQAVPVQQAIPVQQQAAPVQQPQQQQQAPIPQQQQVPVQQQQPQQQQPQQIPVQQQPIKG
ncbi:nucleobindin-2 [Episyrphus balteatus]|uniref:nucleobindin-2 n=1 Tax=Episyrphus balteatus TaxID=286459 RepID=UPI0024866135|nr:nucleobindin-2 [Episyrphus balteatus]XP_055855459.1 nucleobindin-2 [Episyrphus balteatus]